MSKDGCGCGIWPTVGACGWCTVSACCACGINVGQVKRYWQIGIDCNLRWDEWACGIESNGMEAQCLRGFADKWRDFKWLRAEQKVAGFCQLTFNYSSSTPPRWSNEWHGKMGQGRIGSTKRACPIGLFAILSVSICCTLAPYPFSVLQSGQWQLHSLLQLQLPLQLRLPLVC